MRPLIGRYPSIYNQLSYSNVIDPKLLSISFRNPLFYALLTIKLLTVIWLNTLTEASLSTPWSINTVLANYSGDSHAYIKPEENFITEGEYYYMEGHGKEYAGRAPYYGSVYFVIRIFFSHYSALDILAFLQILVDCMAGLILGRIALNLIKKSWAFWITILLYTVSFYQTDYSGRILTESFSSSALVFFVYFLLKLTNDKSRLNYFMAGLWLSIAVVLKPYFAPVYFMIFLFYDKSRSMIYNFVSLVVFGLTLVIIVTPFTIRNYNKFGIIQPFSSWDGGSGITDGEIAFRKYIQSIGESFVFWDPDCAGCLFTDMKVPCNYKFPERIFTATTDSLTLQNARQIYLDYNRNKTTEKEKLVIETFDKIRLDYRDNNLFNYYIGSRLTLLRKFIIQKASYYIYNPYQGGLYYFITSVKIAQYAIYYLITIAGLGGIVILARQNLRLAAIIGVIPVYLLLLFPIVLRAVEWRYWTSSHYFLILSTVILISYLLSRYTGSKSKSNHGTFTGNRK